MHTIQIRLAVREDLPAIHNLVRQLAIFEEAEAEFTATIEQYREDFDSAVFEALVAEVDGEIRGMALYYLTYSTWKGKMLYLEDFVVEEAYRSFGIGQLLFEQVLGQGREKGCKLLKWQVLDWNKDAIRFYEKNNAIIEQEWWNGKIFL
ncbi:MAG: GNAT family N-acetyltransferase [Saprospiraceae bacterium]|nr:GNAT family N-acetyltransferase [Saprospiraceae bacterium]MCB9326098.1 GNAT family N-acetyltransferase [Lewinellaceae bacterium]